MFVANSSDSQSRTHDELPQHTIGENKPTAAAAVIHRLIHDRSANLHKSATKSRLCCCSRISSHNRVRGHRTGSSHSGDEEYLV